jgi:hypothetical protein
MFVLYNCAHGNSSIKSDGDAWIRILGFFQTKQEALLYTKTIIANDNGLEIRITPSNEFRMMLSRKYNDTIETIDMDTRNYEATKLDSLLSKHKESRKYAFEDTANNAKEHQVGQVKFNPIDKINEYQLLHQELVLTLTKELSFSTNISVKPIPPNLTLRMQRFAAIAVIPDYIFYSDLNQKLITWENSKETTNIEDLKEWYHNNPLPSPKGAEPAVSFLMYADTEEELNTWIKTKCQIKDIDIACVTMYEWIKVNHLWSDNIKRYYRESLLETLHYKKDYQHQESLKIQGQAKEIIISN